MKSVARQNVISGLVNNIFGTRVIVQAAVEAGVGSFTLISTDKAVRPTNIMGASKRVAELICQSEAQKQENTKFSIVRFGNVLGSSGSVIPKFSDQISSGGPVTVTDPEITRYFMTIPEAAQLVVQASAMPSNGDIFVLDMGVPVKIVDLVEKMIRLHGLVPYRQSDIDNGFERGDIEIRFTGLRPGEKLYEELFISGEPITTAHPRIFTTNEFSLSSVRLDIILDELLKSCREYDIASIRRILNDSLIKYAPNDEINDLVWNKDK